MKTKRVLCTLVLALGIAVGAQAQQPALPPPLPPPGTAPGSSTTFTMTAPAAFFGVGWSRLGEGQQVVAAVMEDSPAEKAGLAVGDVLISVDGRKMPDGRPVFAEAAPGRKYTLRVKRGEEEKELVIVAAPPRAQQARP